MRTSRLFGQSIKTGQPRQTDSSSSGSNENPRDDLIDLKYSGGGLRLLLPVTCT